LALRTILFGGLFAVCVVGALVQPVLGLVGYIIHYSVGPESQWWGQPLVRLGIRYSFTLAGATALGLALNWNRMDLRGPLLRSQEKLLLVFLAMVWLSVLIGQETVGRYTSAAVDHPSVKFTKVVIFVLMLTHIANRPKRLEVVLWALIAGSLYLGFHAWELPRSAFRSGRLEGVGGPDFAESNFLAAYMAMMLWVIGFQFLRSGWPGRVICFLAGGFTANTIVLTRSRGAVVGLVAGAVMAIIVAPKRHRLKITAGLVIAAIGFFWLTDPQFIERSTTITRSEEERDSSAQARIRLATAGWEMLQDHPLGVGAGNFYQNVGDYMPEYTATDAHNTYVRTATELGVQGIAVFLLLVVNGFGTLRRVSRSAGGLPDEQRDRVRLLAHGLMCALAAMLACCLTVSLTYVEFIWWGFLLPVCLERSVGHQLADAESKPSGKSEKKTSHPKRKDSPAKPSDETSDQLAEVR
jgi:O-antigen ligase